MNELNKFMQYKRLPNIEFPWGYQELLELPIFMKEHIYHNLNEFIEEEKKNMSTLQNKIN